MALGIHSELREHKETKTHKRDELEMRSPKMCSVGVIEEQKEEQRSQLVKRLLRIFLN